MKARACAYGRKQRETPAKEEAASPTTLIESIFLSCVIEPSKGRDFVIIDLPGAFLHADCTHHMIMRFQGWLAKLMVMVAPQIYQEYITTNANGLLVLFMNCKRHCLEC